MSGARVSFQTAVRGCTCVVQSQNVEVKSPVKKYVFVSIWPDVPNAKPQTTLGVVVTCLVRRHVYDTETGVLMMHHLPLATNTDPTRESTSTTSGNQSSSIASTKSPSRKQKSSNAHNATSPTTLSTPTHDNSLPHVASAVRPFRRYSRRTLVALSKSPLVAPPAGMPALKDWFGYVKCTMLYYLNSTFSH